MPDHAPPRTLVAVRPTGGLCNRLRVISSFRVFAECTGRALAVCWAPSAGFSDEDLGELFDNEVPRIGPEDFDRLCAEAACLHDIVSLTGVGARRGWHWNSTEDMDGIFDPRVQPALAYRGPQRLGAMLGPAATRLPRSFRDDYLTDLRSWRPAGDIRRIVDEVAGEFDEHTVGVHVRRGDALDHPRISGQFAPSTDRAFFTRMRAMLRDEPRTRFFLATDCAETERGFRDRFDDVLLTNPNKKFVPSVVFEAKQNQRDAAVDLFALARTRHLLGTRYSSFTRTAADLGGITCEVVVGGAWLDRLRSKLLQGFQARRYRGRAAVD